MCSPVEKGDFFDVGTGFFKTEVLGELDFGQGPKEACFCGAEIANIDEGFFWSRHMDIGVIGGFKAKEKGRIDMVDRNFDEFCRVDFRAAYRDGVKGLRNLIDHPVVKKS